MYHTKDLGMRLIIIVTEHAFSVCVCWIHVCMIDKCVYMIDKCVYETINLR